MFLFSQFVMGYVFSRQMKKRKNFYQLQIVFGLIFVIGAIVLQYLGGMDGKEIIHGYQPFMELISTVLVCFGIMLLIAFWILKSYEVTWAEALYASGLAYLAQHSVYCLQNLLWQKLPLPQSGWLHEVCATLVLLLVAILLYFAVAKHMVYEHHYIASIRETIPLLAMIITIVVVFSALATEYQFVPLHSLYAFIFCIFILLFQLERQKTLEKEEEATIREQLLITQQAQYKIYKENVDLINIKSHDLKHQIAALRTMYDDSLGNEVINSIAGTVRIYDSFVRTGNEGLDTILTAKNQQCMDKNIMFTCIADGKVLKNMDPIDLFTLFGNMMDNAIEAVEHLPKEERSISLSIKEELGMVLITEENPCQRTKQENGRFQTTKEDKANHGYGIRSMEMVVKKYDGTLSADVKDDVFTLMAVLYL